MNKLGSLSVLLLVLAGCAMQPTVSPDTPPVTIMTFNVENLFDNRDDPGKDDSTYLPLKFKKSDAHREHCSTLAVARWRDQCLNYDWSTTALEIKMSSIARAILQVDNGRGPDIVVLQEVENINVLDQLSYGFLSTGRYGRAIMIEGNDARGIDVAFFSRLPLVGQPILHDVAHPGIEQSRIKDTRGILEATFELPDGNLLTGFAVHFPAPYHPRSMRAQAYVKLNELRAALPDGRLAFAAGDFNTTSAEDAQFKMLNRYARPHWVVAHDDCDGCPGTYYYAPDDSWSFLDMILWSRPSRGKKTTWRIRPGSAQLPNQVLGQTTADGKPQRFELPAGTGISDHWPVLITIEKLL